MIVRTFVTVATILFPLHGPRDTTAAAAHMPQESAGILGNDTEAATKIVSAQCLLKVSWDGDMLPSVDQQFMDGLIRSSAVAEAAKREVLGDSGVAEIYPYRIWPSEGQPSNAHVVSVAVQLSGLTGADEPLAERYLAEVHKRLESALAGFAEDHVRDLHAQLAFSEQEAVHAQETVNRLNALQVELCDEADHADLRRDMLFVTIGQLQAQRRELELESVAREARRAALERQLAANAARIKDAAETDSTLLELQKVIEIRKLQLTRIEQLVAAKTASENEAAACREQLAQSKFEFAKQRQISAARLGGEQLSDLNRELTALTIDDAEAEARLKFIVSELEKTKALLPVADRYEMAIHLPLPMAREALESAIRQQSKLKRILGAFQKPVVRSIGADEKPRKK